jgi:hypothetical protein
MNVESHGGMMLTGKPEERIKKCSSATLKKSKAVPLHAMEALGGRGV